MWEPTGNVLQHPGAQRLRPSPRGPVPKAGPRGHSRKARVAEPSWVSWNTPPGPSRAACIPAPSSPWKLRTPRVLGGARLQLLEHRGPVISPGTSGLQTWRLPSLDPEQRSTVPQVHRPPRLPWASSPRAPRWESLRGSRRPRGPPVTGCGGGSLAPGPSGLGGLFSPL